MNKTEFLKILQTERAQWNALLAEVDESRMTSPDAAGNWSVKDIVAHITAYEKGLVAWLGAASRGEVLELPDLDQPNVDRRNAEIFSKNQARSLNDIRQEAQQVFAQLLSLVEALPEADLLEPERSDWFVKPRWQTSRPLWMCIADDSYKHYHQHRADIRARLDQTEK